MKQKNSARRLTRLGHIAFASAIGTLLPRAWGVVTYGTGNNFDFSVSPQNALLSYEGAFGSYTGTTIGSQYLLTAEHTDPGTNTTFEFNNGTSTATTYNIQEIASIDDVAVWQIAPSTTATFATYAPLYSGSGEAGSSIVDIGRGMTRGAGVAGGWAWGPWESSNRPFSWGTNTISAVDSAAQAGASSAFGDDYLQFDFNNNSSNPNEAIDTLGDSGGGLFIDNNGVYQLAGINSLVGQVKNASGAWVGDSLYDTYGYFTSAPGGAVVQITSHNALSSYASRIESKVSFINAVTGFYSAGQDAASPVYSNGSLEFFQTTTTTTGALIGNPTVQIGYASSYTTLQIAPNSGLSEVSSLSLDVNSSFDLTNNGILINYGLGNSPRAALVQSIVKGYDGGLWDGHGIRSSFAASQSSYGVGYSDYSDGIDPSLSAGQLEIAYTLYGDCTLQGAVTGTDLAILAAHWGQQVTGGWSEGDFNYNGIVDAGDFSLLAHNFGLSATGADLTLPASAWSALNAFAISHGLISSVPEPGTASLLIVCSYSLARRRRRLAGSR